MKVKVDDNGAVDIVLQVCWKLSVAIHGRLGETGQLTVQGSHHDIVHVAKSASLSTTVLLNVNRRTGAP
jgi:hypothetical protein